MKIQLSAVMLAALAAPAAMAEADAMATSYMYCGVGYTGAAADLAKNHPHLAAELQNGSGFLPNLSVALLAAARQGNPELPIYERSTSDVKSPYALSFVVAGTNVEGQEFDKPGAPPGVKSLNVIYTLSMQAVVFNTASNSLEQVYPFRYQYMEVRDAEPTDAEKAERFKSFLTSKVEPLPPISDEDAPTTRSFMTAWSSEFQKLELVAEPKTFGVAPVVISDRVSGVLSSVSGDSKNGGSATLSKQITTALEEDLVQALKMPMIPGGKAVESNGREGAQYIASIPGCQSAGSPAMALNLPAPSYLFHLQVDDLAYAKRVVEHFVPNVRANGAVNNATVQKTEEAWGLRFILNVANVDERNGGEWGGPLVVTNQMFRKLGAVTYTGSRGLDTAQQFRKIALGFSFDLARALGKQDDKWIKANLSAQSEAKLADVRKEWKNAFPNQKRFAQAQR